ncbi:MAG: extracellular solute-binding protein [Clostridia bacterium]|nr:extracellular solute-binding protein [Clostridia bacterium]
MKRFIALLLVVVMLLPCFTLFGCKKEKNDVTILRICNCEDYIDEELLSEFEEENPDIDIVYSTYGTNENLYNELVINPNSYDLVVPSEYMIQKLAAEGRLKKLDLTKVPNYTQNVSPYVKNRLDQIEFVANDGEYKGQTTVLSEYMVGYMWGTMGWVYNTEYVSEDEVSSWVGVFDNDTLNGKITLKDAVRDTYLVGLAMAYQNELKTAEDNKVSEILNRTEDKDIQNVGKALSSVKNKLYGFEVDSGKNDIVLGNIYAYVAWSGDAAYAIDVAAGEVEDEDGTTVQNTKMLSYSIPKEGSNIWFDGFVMPAASTNDDAVYRFLNFISDPENVYRNMDYTGYTSMVAGDVIYEDIVLDWFDETEYYLSDIGYDVETLSSTEIDTIMLGVTEADLNDNGYKTVDLSYLFGGATGDYTVIVSFEGYGRLMAQYPEESIVNRCAIMNYFDDDTLAKINKMWESVKSPTFPMWVINLIIVAVVLLAAIVVLYRCRDKIKWFKLPERKSDYAKKRGLKLVKREEV